MGRRLGVAGLQLKWNRYSVAENLRKFESTSRGVKSAWPWIDLIFTGELFIQQYGKDDMTEFADSIPNDTTDRLSELAQDIECWLVPGSFWERDGDEIYNTAIAFNPKGEIVAKYRKLYPWMPSEDVSYGTDFVVFDIPGLVKIGLVICYDLWFPEIFRTLVWKGADVILQPSATTTPDRPA
ncbi:MAG: carbon-nitrogen hydrolase family protein, partial [Candidatus Thorarchaeota archaeon]